jgi:hypothetical protein
VGYARRNFMVPRPRFATWEEFNAHLLIQCQKRRERRLRGHQQTIGERFEHVVKSLDPSTFWRCIPVDSVAPVGRTYFVSGFHIFEQLKAAKRHLPSDTSSDIPMAYSPAA